MIRQSRTFTEETLPKMDGLMLFLEKNQIPFSVHYLPMSPLDLHKISRHAAKKGISLRQREPQEDAKLFQVVFFQ